MSVITASHLTKRYGRTAAVDDVSFDISRGEIVGFLGPNGAGKTTTLRMLAGLIHPTRGSSSILGRSVPGASLLDVGTMIEEPSFYPYMSGRGNLRHASMLHGGIPDARIDEVLRFVRMDRAADKKVAAYSQGMRQRLGLARALLWKPQVLLLDEPSNGLDPVGIAEIRENLRATALEGVTILISSHILAEIEKFVERILVIEKGKLLFDGPLHALLVHIDEQRVMYRLEAGDGEALAGVLTDLDLRPQLLDERSVRVGIPSQDVAGVLRTLLSRGVDLVEARREADNLEDAYLRLLREDGRPS